MSACGEADKGSLRGFVSPWRHPTNIVVYSAIVCQGKSIYSKEGV